MLLSLHVMSDKKLVVISWGDFVQESEAATAKAFSDAGYPSFVAGAKAGSDAGSEFAECHH